MTVSGSSAACYGLPKTVDGAAIRAGFVFDVPVRFDTQRLAVQMAYFSEDDRRGVGSVPDIPLIEVKE